LLTECDSQGRRILLSDFGIAREIADISGLTATNMVVGTTGYSAPGQLMGSDIDGRADEYALSCTAFHLLTGRSRFKIPMRPWRPLNHRGASDAIDPIIAAAVMGGL
jgi:serine/threonine protein kinase, bacterial